jgi:hypothetical protein
MNHEVLKGVSRTDQFIPREGGEKLMRRPKSHTKTTENGHAGREGKRILGRSGEIFRREELAETETKKTDSPGIRELADRDIRTRLVPITSALFSSSIIQGRK